MYEHFEHTADLGQHDFRITAGARVLASCKICTCRTSSRRACAFLRRLSNGSRQFNRTSNASSASLEPRSTICCSIGCGPCCWLRVKHDEEKLVFGKFTVNLTDNGLTATAWGEPLDDGRHLRSREVKAITYHELLVEERAEGWLAEVIVDI